MLFWNGVGRCSPIRSYSQGDQATSGHASSDGKRSGEPNLVNEKATSERAQKTAKPADTAQKRIRSPPCKRWHCSGDCGERPKAHSRRCRPNRKL
jgi:hypothetical protein